MLGQADTGKVRADKPIARSRSSRPSQKQGLPENYDYRDTGCELASSCLECPLAMCKYDDPDWGRGRRTAMRDQEIVRLRAEGWQVSRIAEVVKCSQRTVYRVLERGSGQVLQDSQTTVSMSEVRDGMVVPVEQLAVWMEYSMRVPEAIDTRKI